MYQVRASSYCYCVRVSVMDSVCVVSVVGWVNDGHQFFSKTRQPIITSILYVRCQPSRSRLRHYRECSTGISRVLYAQIFNSLFNESAFWNYSKNAIFLTLSSTVLQWQFLIPELTSYSRGISCLFVRKLCSILVPELCFLLRQAFHIFLNTSPSCFPLTGLIDFHHRTD